MSDSQNAIAAPHNFLRYCSDLDPLLSSIINLLPSIGFEGFIFRPRNTNGVAHNLVNYALHAKVSALWGGVLSLVASQALAQDWPTSL